MFARLPARNRRFFQTIKPSPVTFRGKAANREFVIELPQLYTDWSLMIAHFPASAAAIRALLPPDSGLEPVTVAPGIGLVTLGAFDYRKPQTLAPYKEVGVMFPVRYRPLLPLPAVPLFRPEWFTDLGFYIWQLPVTTEEACDAGVELWNFPKSLGKIDFTEVDNRRRCTWSAKEPDGEVKRVLTLEVRKSTTTLQLRNYLAYSVIDDRLQQTLVQTFGEYDESRFGFDASFALGEHSIAVQMRRLGMLDTPVGRLYSPQAEGILPGPSAVPFASVPAVLRTPRAMKGRPLPRSERVAILGGGVAGLSAAHELAERGFDVTVFEAKALGGKARSFGVPDTGRRPLPAEHGFRFFPGFYKHLPHTMARIPCGPGRTAADNLVATTRLTVELVDDAKLIFPTRLPVSLADVGSLVASASLLQQRTGCNAEEVAHYLEKVWTLLTSCNERRMEEYENKSWWDFIDAEGSRPQYQQLANTTRALVAADPKKSSTRTVGNILLQMLFDLATPGVSVDRVLNGPTNEVWIDPWVVYLKKLGVEFKTGELQRIDLDRDGRVSGVVVDGETVRAQYYVAAVPVERMAVIVKQSDLDKVDPALKNVIELSRDVETMAGIQFYFEEPLPLEGGHLLHLDSEWALTSLAQAQFWTRDLAAYGNGKIRDILSVDISDFHARGNRGRGKSAEDSTREEIEIETWRQLRESVPVLKTMDYKIASLDPAIGDKPGPGRNAEPLLVNTKGHWHLRPQATTGIPNLFLASDYVQTYTDLATMEGANEAARRAVNGILAASRSSAPLCATWDQHEPVILSPWRWIDRNRYRIGLPWNSDFPILLQGLELGLTVLDSVARAVGLGASETPDGTIPPEVQAAVGDLIEALIDDLRRGDPAAVRRHFAPHALVTIGLDQGGLKDFLPELQGKLDVTVKAVPRRYQLGGRVHVVLTIRVGELHAQASEFVEGHVHVVLVPSQTTDKSRPPRASWTISSLRYREAGAPARREVPLDVRRALARRT